MRPYLFLLQTLLKFWAWWYFIVIAISYLGEGFPDCASGKEPTCQCRRHKKCRFDPWFRRSPGGGHGNPFQASCLENPMDREAWQATVHRVSKSWTQMKQLSMHISHGEYEPELWSPVEARRKQNSDMEKLTELQNNSNWYELPFSTSILSELLNFHLS